MYTVLRFTQGQSTLAQMADIGAELNAVSPGTYKGLRARGDGFSCELSSNDTWETHRDVALKFIRAHEATIRRAVSLGANVTLDVALEPEDRRGSFTVVRCDNDLLSSCAAVGLALELTVYP